jgi:hypothetical protein
MTELRSLELIRGEFIWLIESSMFVVDLVQSFVLVEASSLELALYSTKLKVQGGYGESP